MDNAKKIGLIACIGIVAGNMMGSGIALLPANLASIGSIAITGWIISLIGALSLAYVFAKLATKDPEEGGPIAYANEVSSALGFQTGALYYHANWIGNLAITTTAVSYLSVFYPILNEAIPAGILSLALIWLFTFINLLGGQWISRLTTFGLILILIPVIGTAIFGWLWFDKETYLHNWNVSHDTDYQAVVSSTLLCLWAFVGIESASVNSALVKNPKKTIPLATMIGAFLAGIVYILATQVIFGMYPAAEMAVSGAPFSKTASTMLGEWASPVVSIFTVIACLTSLGSWMMLVGQAGARAAHDGNFPKVYGKMDKNGIPRKGLILAAIQMSILLTLVTLANAESGRASTIFKDLINIAVLLTMLPYFYSCLNLIRVEGMSAKRLLSLTAAIFGSIFCFIALLGSTPMQLSGTFIVSLIILMFYAKKLGDKRDVVAENQ